MKTITIKETRNNLAEIIDQVSIVGESFLITKFGKAKAIISPLTESDTSASEKLEQLRSQKGSWKNRSDIKDPLTWSNQTRLKASSRTK